MPKDDPELVGAQLADAVRQLSPTLPAFAKLSREYFGQLKGEGFDDKEALYLSAKFIESIIFGKNK
jgi:hypothetical protein